MNKQEVIEKLQSKAVNHCSETSGWTKKIELDIAIDIINQLDEPVKLPEPEPWKPEKPVVPQYVADWYERNKDDLNTSIYSTITRIFMKANDEDLLTAFESWLMCNENSIVTVVSMHQFGYEVENEKLYTARLKGIAKEKESYVYKIIESGEIYLSDLVFIEGKSQVYFTQTELENLKYWNNPAFKIVEVAE